MFAVDLVAEILKNHWIWEALPPNANTNTNTNTNTGTGTSGSPSPSPNNNTMEVDSPQLRPNTGVCYRPNRVFPLVISACLNIP